MLRRNKRVLRAVGILISFSFILFFYSRFGLKLNLHGKSMDKTAQNDQVRVDLGQKLRILMWKNGASKSWGFFSKAKTGIQECPFSCEVVGDNKMADSVDAIVVLGISNEKLPKRRKFEENQLRVFYRQESPTGYPNYAHPYPNNYNWTMTYRTDSDVWIPYGYLKELSPEDKLLARNLNYTLDFAQSKTKLIAWTASHCDTSSQREQLVLDLNKHVPVDIYGKCGKLFNSSLSCSTKRFASNYKNCYAQLGQQYKFYLSFENSVCFDYITEKLWDALRSEMVPIVYGGANYEQLAPPGSYINALDFPSVKMLAVYLKYLDQNPEEYLKYFEWKRNYQVVGLNNWCALCEKLWQHSEVREDGRRIIQRNYSRIYPDILDWLQHEPEHEPRTDAGATSKNGAGSKNSRVAACRTIKNIQDLKKTFYPKSLLENGGALFYK